MWQDGRQALRVFGRQPGLAIIVCVTLALGVGANTAIFSVVDGALFRRLPFSDVERLVDIQEVQRRGTAEETRHTGMSWERLEDWRRQTQLFESVASYSRATLVPVSPDPAQVGPPELVGRVSPGLLAFLGLQPQLGREFLASDLRPGLAGVVVVSEAYWKRILSGAPDVIGSTLRVGECRCRIVGVAPNTFRFLVGMDTAVWLPQTQLVSRQRSGPQYTNFVGRIRSGFTLADAEDELDRAATMMQRDRTQTSRWEVDLAPVDEHRYGQSPPIQLALLGAVGFVVLVGCANVANLLLVNGISRRRELVLRSALGASRARLVRLFLLEGFLLTGMGGGVGVVVAWWSLSLIPPLVPTTLQYSLFGANPLTLDLRVIGTSLVVVVVVALLCSLMPALHASQATTRDNLVGGRSKSAAGSARAFRSTLLGLQVALTLVLLAGAGLLTNSFGRMVLAEPGFDIDRLAAIHLAFRPDANKDATQQRAALVRVFDAVRALPGVETGIFGSPPGVGGGGRFVVEGPDGQPIASGLSLTIHEVTPGYFGVTGIPLRLGRDLAVGDGQASLPVGVVDEATARRAWPDETPIGKRFRYSPNVPWITVVGVSGSIKTEAFVSRDNGQIYLPIAQQNSRGYRNLLLRSADPEAAVAAAGRLVPILEPSIVVDRSHVSTRTYDPVLSAPRFYLQLMGLLAVLALLTATVGLYGLLAWSVNQRTREFGIRAALGADARQLRALVFGQALLPISTGMVVGLVGVNWLTSLLRSQLYQVSPHDPLTLALVVVILLLVAALAAVVPARRATAVNPVLVLRHD